MQYYQNIDAESQPLNQEYFERGYGGGHHLYSRICQPEQDRYFNVRLRLLPRDSSKVWRISFASDTYDPIQKEELEKIKKTMLKDLHNEFKEISSTIIQQINGSNDNPDSIGQNQPINSQIE